MRLFVAVELAADVRRALGEVRDRLRTALTGVKWVEGKNFHITLHFLGEVSPSLVPAIKTALGEAAAEVGPFELRFEGLGAFPNLKRPRVIWAGAGGGEQLLRLQQQVEVRLEALLPGEGRSSARFNPHITLGRVRLAPETSALAGLLQEYRGSLFGRQEVRSFSLMESQLSRHGPVYTCLARYQLGAIIDNFSKAKV